VDFALSYKWHAGVVNVGLHAIAECKKGKRWPRRSCPWGCGGDLLLESHYFAIAFLKTIPYHQDPRHQSVVVRIVPPATTNPPKINPHTDSP
jgi:hypothetical protein